MDWEMALVELARTDPWYQECMENQRQREADYQRIRATLSEEDGELLDFFIVACQEVQHAKTLLAYEMGIAHGTITPKTLPNGEGKPRSGG